MLQWMETQVAKIKTDKALEKLWNILLCIGYAHLIQMIQLKPKSGNEARGKQLQKV